MAGQNTWLVDFDETLASGNITWAFQYTFPKFIRAHHLNVDPERLASILLVLQERVSQDPDVTPLLRELFEHMDWPQELGQSLLDDLFQNYRPALFDDALPFLNRLNEKHERVLVVSNNPRTPGQVRLLEIEPYVHRVITPDTCPDTLPKPHRSLWEFILANETGIDPEATIVVGDDPWSDGAFADDCGLSCWIVDRMSRFTELYDQRPYRWVRSLSEIPI